MAKRSRVLRLHVVADPAVDAGRREGAGPERDRLFGSNLQRVGATLKQRRVVHIDGTLVPVCEQVEQHLRLREDRLHGRLTRLGFVEGTTRVEEHFEFGQARVAEGADEDDIEA